MLTVLFIAMPCRAVLVTDVLNIGTDYETQQIEYPIVKGTLNLYPGAEVYSGMMSQAGCFINFYGGQMMGSSYIIAFERIPLPTITVYGSGFAINGEACDPLATEFMLKLGEFSTLTGFYENGDPINLMFYGNIAIHLVSVDSGMEIDIKPGNEDNNINLQSNGMVSVAVWTTEKFDAATVNPLTTEFAGASPKHWRLEDFDADGDKDLIFQFRTQELNLTEESTEATLTTQLISQTAAASVAEASSPATISATDKVKIVGAKKARVKSKK